jgi:hypothetical protein
VKRHAGIEKEPHPAGGGIAEADADVGRYVVRLERAGRRCTITAASLAKRRSGGGRWIGEVLT